MKILRISFLIGILSVSFWLGQVPVAFAQQTRAEATYAKCQEIERYYLAEIQKPLPTIPNPDFNKPLILAYGKGFFWNQPNDAIFIPSEDDNAIPVVALTQEGSYLYPRIVTCDLNKGQIKIDMKAFVRLEGRKRPLVIDQVDEMLWDGNSEVFKGAVIFSTKKNGTFFKLDSDFAFRGCNADGVDCSLIDILMTFFPLDGSACRDLAQTNYGLELKNPDEISNCTLYNDNLNYFQDNPREVVVYENRGQEIIGPHVQVLNNVRLEATYKDGSILEYKGLACFMPYTSNARQDWTNQDIKTELCSPKEVIEKVS